MTLGGQPAEDSLRERVARYMRAHHTMTIATVGLIDMLPGDGSRGVAAPHAASVFYAVDDALRLVFLSKPSSVHGLHIGQAALVAVTITEDYDDWEQIQGIQLWGEARLLAGGAKAGAMALYLRRFPFVREMLAQPELTAILRSIGVYRVEPARVAFTDNTTGVFGRESLELR